MVTGANGFIGSHLVKRLLSFSSNSLVLLSSTSRIDDKYLLDGKSLNDSLVSYSADVRNRDQISEIFEYEKPDTCIHLAAKTSVADSIRNPDETMDTNVNGTVNVLDACYKSNVDSFVFASSAAVYGDVRELPIRESEKLTPLSPYGKSKMIAEQQVSLYKNQKKIKNAISLRIFNVYGVGKVGQSDVITAFISRLLEGLPPIIRGSGTHTRDFISIDDVVNGILLSVKAMKKQYGHTNNILDSSTVFNLGTGIPTSINELARKLIMIFDLDLEPIHDRTTDNRIIQQSYADITKSKKILQFVPKKDIDTGLKEMIGRSVLRK